MKNKTQQTLRKPYVAQFYHRNRLAYFCGMLLPAGFISGVNLVVTWLMQQIIDTVSGVPGSREVGTLCGLTVIVILLIIPIEGLEYLFRPRFMSRAMTQYKDFAFRKLTGKNMASFRSENTAVYLSAFSNDMAAIETNYLEKQYKLTFNLVVGTGAMFVMLLYSPVLTLIALGFCVLPIIVSIGTGGNLAKAEKAVSERNNGFVASLKDIVSGFSVIKSFRAEGAALDILEKSSEAVEETKRKKRKISTVVSTIGSMAGIITQLGTFLVGAALVLIGIGITPGVLIAFMNLTGLLIGPISEMPELLTVQKAALGLVDKMAAALESNIQDEGRDIPNHLDIGISVHNLRFGYEPDSEILHDIDVDLKAGKSYAIVGNSGSGKSTLLNLLMASCHDYEGTICFDSSELREISSKSLYELVSMIEQNVFVFDASIRDNITMFREFPAEEVDRAIELSGLSQVIEQHGADYLCGENGRGLSGGEKQRISIARSLLQKSSVLLADEVTAALDAQTAHQVISDILKLDGMTRIIVTHALVESLLRQYDGIIVLKDGQIVERGTFEDLMEQKGYFYALYTVAQ